MIIIFESRYIMSDGNIRLPRRILYVDASFCNQTQESKICLYDVDENRLDILKTKLPTSSSFSERYAIVYGCLYAKKLNILNKKVHILCDNYGATVHTKIKELCSILNISISWIPREINTIADKGTQENCNIQNEDVQICDLFYELMIEKDMIKKDNSKTDETNILPKTSTSENEKNILLNALKHLQIENRPYISLGQMGKFLKHNNPTFTYSSLKKILEKYPKDFRIVNSNYVKRIN